MTPAVGLRNFKPPWCRYDKCPNLTPRIPDPKKARGLKFTRWLYTSPDYKSGYYGPDSCEFAFPRYQQTGQVVFQIPIKMTNLRFSQVWVPAVADVLKLGYSYFAHRLSEVVSTRYGDDILDIAVFAVTRWRQSRTIR